MSLGLTDQLFSSVSNAFIVIGVARVSTVTAFGVTAIFMTILTAAVAICRGLLGTPLLLAGRGEPEKRAADLNHSALIAALSGASVGAAILAIGALIGDTWTALAIAVACPVVMVQDTFRFAAIAARTPGRAVAWDGLWAAGSAVVLAMTWSALGGLTTNQVLWAWTGLALASLVGLLMTTPGATRFRPGLRVWWAESRADRIRYGAEAGVGATSALLVVAIATAFVGASAAAALRGAETVLGPLSILFSAIPLAVVPDAVRDNDPQRTWRTLRLIATLMSTLALAIGAASLALPDSWGELALGDSWQVVSPLLPIIGLEYAALAWVSVSYTGLKAAGRSRALMNLRAIHATSSLVLGGCAAALWQSARAVAIALALTAILVAMASRPILSGVRGRGKGGCPGSRGF